jgi:hypothetical protein
LVNIDNTPTCAIDVSVLLAIETTVDTRHLKIIAKDFIWQPGGVGTGNSLARYR